MRFSDNGYYIERYIKCSNCGVLLYDDSPPIGEEAAPFCSAWCQEWSRLRETRDGLIELPLPAEPGRSARS